MAADELNCPKCGLRMGGRAETVWTDRSRWTCTKCDSELQYSMSSRLRNKTFCLLACLVTIFILSALLGSAENANIFVLCGGIAAAVLLGYFLRGKVELVEP